VTATTSSTATSGPTRPQRRAGGRLPADSWPTALLDHRRGQRPGPTLARTTATPPTITTTTAADTALGSYGSESPRVRVSGTSPPARRSQTPTPGPISTPIILRSRRIPARIFTRRD